jgi:hypothetical protein
MKSSRTRRSGATPARSNPAPPPPAEADPSAASAPPPVPLGDPLGDPAAIQHWLDAGRAAALDLLAAAREGARRPRKRVLSRAEIRRQARDAFAQVTALLDLAAEALRKPA